MHSVRLSFGHFCSRLSALKDDFAFALSYADHVVITAVQIPQHHSCISFHQGLITNITISYARFILSEKKVLGMFVERI